MRTDSTYDWREIGEQVTATKATATPKLLVLASFDFIIVNLSIWTPQRNDAGCIGTISVVLADGVLMLPLLERTETSVHRRFCGQLSRA